MEVFEQVAKGPPLDWNNCYSPGKINVSPVSTVAGGENLPALLRDPKEEILYREVQKKKCSWKWTQNLVFTSKKVQKHFLNKPKKTSKKAGKGLFWNQKLSKMSSRNGQNMANNFYLAHLLAIWAENTATNGPFKSKNNTLKLPKLL